MGIEYNCEVCGQVVDGPSTLEMTMTPLDENARLIAQLQRVLEARFPEYRIEIEPATSKTGKIMGCEISVLDSQGNFVTDVGEEIASIVGSFPKWGR